MCSYCLNFDDWMCSITLQILFVIGFDGGSVNIAHLDFELEDKDLCDSILASIEPHVRRVGRMSFRDKELVAASVTSSFVFLPTNCPVYGLSSILVPDWNSMDICHFGKIARVSFLTSDDNGLFIVVCTPSMHRMVIELAGAAGWEEDHSTVTVCKTPICKVADMSVRCLLVTVWKKSQPPNTLDISRPTEDTWFDTIDKTEWTMQENGEPLRGNNIIICRVKLVNYVLFPLMNKIYGRRDGARTMLSMAAFEAIYKNKGCCRAIWRR